ncbi:hypothetical protein CHS0354_004892 [Potamilus streckersoni]|uniref:Uncharacterized protein n=1 Tax=Potamilus streckersoni TaxID=2493646 RepID=A0AAE0SQS8_9BIVA|nr:hypothetical protein CHS0354_004892 [Potamilus streckersoni]
MTLARNRDIKGPLGSCKMTEERDKAFRKRMEAFPCQFNLDIKFGFTTVNRRNIIEKLSDEMETTGFELDAEWTRTFNVLSFLRWRLGDYKNAKMYSEKALLIRQDDVMALANQAWMHWKRCEFSEAQRILEKLEQLKGRRDLIVISKAEQAFAYTRFGPKYYKKAIELFQDVIASAIEFKLEETYINLWKFGLGLTLKRQLHFVNVVSFDHLSTPVDSFRDAIIVLFDVAQNANTPRYKARAWVSLGELAHSIHNEDMLSPQDKEGLPKEFKHKKTEEFFDTALNICQDDVYVLGRYGRQARYSRDYNKSIQLLRRSVEIRGTSLAHPHLAKAIKSALNKEIGASVHKRSRGLCEIDNRQVFCTPVIKNSDGGYNKFLENQKARRNLFPDCEQNMDGHGNDKLLKTIRVFENSPISLSSTQSSVARKSANIECRGSIQRDSGIFSLTTTDDLTAKLALFKMSDAAPTSYIDGKDESIELQRQASNTFSEGDRAKAVDKDLTCSDDDQAKTVDTNLVISSRKYNPSSVGGLQGQGHKTYGGDDSKHSFSGRGYQNMRAWHRGKTRGPQGIRFGERRGRGHILDRSQSSEPLFPRSEYYQSSASTSKGIISRQISSPGGEDKLENRPFQSQQRKVIMPIGSPQKVLRYPKNDKRVEEILHHLGKSLEYAPSNCAAIYDIGLIFR